MNLLSVLRRVAVPALLLTTTVLAPITTQASAAEPAQPAPQAQNAQAAAAIPTYCFGVQWTGSNQIAHVKNCLTQQLIIAYDSGSGGVCGPGIPDCTGGTFYSTMCVAPGGTFDVDRPSRTGRILYGQGMATTCPAGPTRSNWGPNGTPVYVAGAKVAWGKQT